MHPLAETPLQTVPGCESDLAASAPSAPADNDWLGAWRESVDMAYCRAPDDRILEANLPFARKFGRTHAALAGCPATELLHPDDHRSLKIALEALTRPPHRCATEQRWITPQGVRWLACEETAIRDDAGVLIAIRVVGRDITRQRLAEEQFYRLSRAVEQSPVAIVITDPEGQPQYVNSKFTQVSGNTLESILDQHLQVLREGHPDDASYRAMWDAIRQRGEWEGELATRRDSRAVIWESVKVSCLRSPAGEVTNLLCLREDITARKQLEAELRQAQKMESLGTLAGGIAHDFNNLLAIVSGYAEMCQRDATDAPTLKKALREIERAAQRASGLVRQILTFSRKTEVKFASVDLNQLTRDLVALLAETFPRTVTFQLELHDGLPVLRADANQLQQIVLNFCVNARDAMPKGGNITLRTAVVSGAALLRLGADPERHYACLQVADTGVGMPPEVRQRIFEPFFTTKQASGGTGLGLAVVYGIVVAHHGFIEVDSTPGTGTEFSIYLPLADNPSALTAAVSVDRAFPGGTESLLIVEDELSLRTLLATVLTRKGYRVSTAATGLEAVELLVERKQQVDLVLLDLNLPGASGLEVFKVIRAASPATKVLVVSGHVTADVRAEFESLGQPHFVLKPYKLDEVGRQLRVLLGASTAAAESS